MPVLQLQTHFVGGSMMGAYCFAMQYLVMYLLVNLFWKMSSRRFFRGILALESWHKLSSAPSFWNSVMDEERMKPVVDFFWYGFPLVL